MEKDFEQIAMRVSVVSIITNIALALIKLFVGVVANSGAMISDAVHSASDVFSTFIVMIGIKISAKDSDKEHPYGHERMECVAAIILSTVLFITGFGIASKAIGNILNREISKCLIPGQLAMFAAILSIVVKEGMFWYTKINAQRIDSGALMADAWHHRSDSLSSIGALIGIIGARGGYPVMDSIASMIICVFIIKASYDIFKDAVNKMIDKSCDEEIEHQIEDCVNEQDGVLGIDLLQTRVFGSKIYVDLEIKVDGNKSLYEAHEIAERIHETIEQNFNKVKHIMIHVNPN